jgi:type VI secretion system protein ImpH
MDATSGKPSALVAHSSVFDAGESLLELLQEEPFSFSFFQAVRLLERLYSERMPTGYFVSPKNEVLRFTSRTSLAFPASEVHGFQESDAGPDGMEVNFLGLTTVNGAFPSVYAEYVLDQIRAKDYALGDFLDIFNHRFISLFYRSWKKYRFYIAYEVSKTRRETVKDPITSVLYSLLGLGTKGLLDRTTLPDEAMLYYAGLLGRNVPTAQALKQLLNDFFQVPVRIEEFSGTWNYLPKDDLSYLSETGRQPECLGVGTVVGDSIWDQHGTVTVRLGPMSFEQYRDFLPGSGAARQLEVWLRLFGQGEFDFLIRLVLAREEVPKVPLTSEEQGKIRLGFESWLKTRSHKYDVDDFEYRLHT